jgi:hypothetical protein
MFVSFVFRRLFPLVVILSSLLAAPVSAQQVPAQQVAAQQKVDLELILMVDGSGSVDDDEYLLQRLGYAQALRNPRVIAAIGSGPLGRIALSYVEWSGADLKVPIVPWTVLSDRASIEAVARRLEKEPRVLYGGGTAVGDAILYGAQSLDTNGIEGKRRVIDLSGDGPDRDGLPAAFGRDRAVAKGITVNGLPILGEFANLDVFFLDNVIGGPGAFSIPAKTFKDFNSAVLTKLIREIAWRREVPPLQRAANVQGPRPAGP